MRFFAGAVVFFVFGSLGIGDASAADSPKLLDYLSPSAYNTLAPIDPTGYFAVSIRYVHPPRVEWAAVQGASRYELLLLQKDKLLGVTPATGSPCFISNGWAKTRPGKAAVVIQAFDAGGKRIALSRMFPIYVVPDFNAKVCAPRKRAYTDAATKVFRKIFDYHAPASALPEGTPATLQKHPISLACTSTQNGGLGGPAFPNLHDWMYIEMAIQMLPHADAVRKKQIAEFAASVGDHLLMCRLPMEGNAYGGMVRGCVDISGRSGIAVGGLAPAQQEKMLRLVEPSKCGYSGLALIRIFEITGQKKYLDAAQRIAEVLVDTQLDDGSWPARVDGKTGEVLGKYSTSVAAVVRFLYHLNAYTPDARFISAAKKGVSWLMAYPVKSYGWVVNFDDNPAPASTVNPYIGLSNWDLFEFVRFLSEYPDAIPNSAAVAREQMNWADNHFVFYGSDPYLPYEPFYPVCAEQGGPGSPQSAYACWVPMDFHTANWTSALLAAYHLTGDKTYLEKALYAGNALTQYQLNDGSTMTWMCDRTFGLSSQYSGTSGTHQFWQAAWAMCAAVWSELDRS